MSNKGSNLGKNAFNRPMASSMGNACEISSKVLQSLEAHSVGNPGIAAEASYLLPIDATLQQAGVAYIASFESRTGATQTLEDFEKGNPVEVNAWWRMLTDVYAEGTPQFNTLWGHGNRYFYNFSRTVNLQHMNALVTNIGSDASLTALKSRVTHYITAYQTKINTQTGDKTEVKTDTSNYGTAVTNSATALLVVYCGLVRLYPTILSKVLAFFPMELIYLASKMREYRRLIPPASRRKICSRTWKTTDTIKLVNNRLVDLYIGLAVNKDGAVEVWYLLPAGAAVTIAPSALGNTTLKSVIVQNNDIAAQGDITLTIFEH